MDAPPPPSDGDGATMNPPGGPGSPPEAPAGPMSLDDAKVNLFTLVQSFVGARSVDGVWPLKDKARGGLLRLTIAGTEAKKVRELDGSRFRGTVPFSDVKTGRAFDAEFTVDLGSPEWKVLGMSLRPGKAKGKGKGKKKAAPKAAAPEEPAPADPAGP